MSEKTAPAAPAPMAAIQQPQQNVFVQAIQFQRNQALDLVAAKSAENDALRVTIQRQANEITRLTAALEKATAPALPLGDDAGDVNGEAAPALPN